ncbi:MAG: hypothetical protein GXY28_07780 [Bacteriovoracaceae bacterium]|jgi:outer membrane murein-binding lipoprotein Lpp|nr:hypothetical protein [Bacteriovoracaceae bacterium]HPX51348.1 hypothetical protein [Deltaproteobacteria bacterium]HQA71153.1 hypothetical protein [Deltaproteobacteria bacterium]HRR19824.1 hypothetical protein [Desulfomonilia bacterium]HRR67676.1 hypothetical protein [Desulfomonilia bacterium]
MKRTGKRIAAAFIVSLSIAGSALLAGCDGSEAAREAEETVRELSGAELIDKGERLKQQIRDLNAKDIERIQEDISKGIYGQE